MKNLFFLFALVSGSCLCQETTRTIIGTVTDGSSPLPNVAIAINEDPKIMFTDDKGKYSIEANLNDNIKYSYQGFKSVVIKVEDVTRILNVGMVLDVEELQEVTVLGSNRKSQQILEQEYPANQDIIKTAFGYLNAATAPGNIRFLRSEEISPIFLCILDLLKNRFSGIRVQGECSGPFGPSNIEGSGSGTNLSSFTDDSEIDITGRASNAGTGINSNLNQGKVFIRGTSSISNQRSAIFDVDGQILNQAPIWLDINNIRRLAILNNFAASTAYGNAGAGGVIVINTIIGNPKADEIYDRARLRNNFASKTILSQSDVKKNAPVYLTEIHKSTSFQEAKNQYAHFEKTYGGHSHFVLDMQKYFSDRWNDPDFTNEIVDSKINLFENNPVLLKALAYQYEGLADYEKANTLYKKVLELRPAYLQSYRDLANSYRDLQQSQRAGSLYARYNYLLEEGILKNDSITFADFFEREYNNFLMLDKARILKGENASELYVAEEDFEGTRLVFEWNDSEAEFELQFVNPENQFFMFKHSQADNTDLITREKEFGYSSVEYLLDSSLPGLWKVNLNYLGNKSLTPSYLKATVYYNYGTFAQRKETKVFKLALKNVPYELFSISVGSKLAFNER